MYFFQGNQNFLFKIRLLNKILLESTANIIPKFQYGTSVITLCIQFQTS